MVTWFFSWLVTWLLHCLVTWLLSWLVTWFLHWLVTWFLSWPVTWFLSWLVTWLLAIICQVNSWLMGDWMWSQRLCRPGAGNGSTGTLTSARLAKTAHT